jgi:hypothetical protein
LTCRFTFSPEGDEKKLERIGICFGETVAVEGPSSDALYKKSGFVVLISLLSNYPNVRR